jgi:3-methylcrotonyl-CoA carboxylase beta subunit
MAECSISVMGGEQAASVLAQVRREQAGRDDPWNKAQEEAFKAPIRAQYETQGIPTMRAHGCG